MSRWRVPETVRLPAESDEEPSPFAFNGRLSNGDQVMGCVGSRRAETHPDGRPFTVSTAVLFRFDADGVLRSCEFASTTRYGGDPDERDEKANEAAREVLAGFVQGVRAKGWASADILVRPCYVVVGGFETGLVYRERPCRARPGLHHVRCRAARAGVRVRRRRG